MRSRTLVPLACCLAVLSAGCSSSAQQPEQLTVGAYNFEENRLVAEIYAAVLGNAGIEVQKDYTYSTRDVLGDAFSQGRVDVVPEYLGTLTDTVSAAVGGDQAQAQATSDPAATADQLRSLVEPYDVVVTDPAPAQSQLQFAVRADFAQQNALTKLSDLQPLASTLTFAGPVGCTTSASCLPGLQQTYGVTFGKVILTDTGGPTTLYAVQSGAADVGLVFTTDPAVSARGLVILADDKGLQVADNVTGLLAKDSASDEVRGLINGVAARLTTDELRALNGQVTIEGYPESFVAARWAAAQGLIPAEAVGATPTPTPPPTPTPTPTPTPEPAAGGTPAPAANSGGNWSRNMGEPSSAAQSQNWDALAQCESGGDPTIISSNGLYHGLYQFSVPTWQAMGGSGAASSASAEEQTYRAQILWDQSGPGQWPVCGKNL